jgi:RimJ/RimL family protein N-acetyltransferase
VYDRFPFLESIYHLRDDICLAPFPVGGDLPRPILDELIAIQKNDAAIVPSTNWRNTFLVDMPKFHREDVYHTWIVGRFSGSVLEEIIGTVDIQFVDYVSRSRLAIPLVGYWTNQKYRGQGIASLALCKMMEVYNLPKYAARIEKDNLPSLRLAKSCRFEEVSYDEVSEYYYFECNFRS